MRVGERNPELNRMHEFCLIKRNHGVLETELAMRNSSAGRHEVELTCPKGLNRSD
jgi:hypothetical protein